MNSIFWRLTVHVVLSVALEGAIVLDLVTFKACAQQRKRHRASKSAERKIHALNQRQAERFLLAARKNRLAALFVLSVTTGMRQGELFGLQWPDVILETGTITGRPQLIEIRGERALGEPISAAGLRSIKLPALARNALRNHRERTKKSRGVVPTRGYVFTDSHGGPLRKSNFTRKAFKPIQQRAKLPVISLHDLRHTAATLALAAGVSVKAVQDQLGHADVQLMLNTYSHVLPAMQTDAAARINAAFSWRDATGSKLAVIGAGADAGAKKKTPQPVAG